MKKITAEQLMAQLNADPEFRRKRAAKEQERAKLIAEDHQAQAPLIEELRSAGLELESVFDLLNKSARYSISRYPKALPILVEHLQRPYPANVRAGIASALALAIPEARFAWDRLVQLYRNEREAWPKSRLADALSAIADSETIEDVIRLARDKQNGSSRLLLLRALEQSSDPRAYETLVELESDEELEKEIKIILRRMKKAGVEQVASDASGGAIASLAEASLNFDADMVEPFLNKLSIEGFGPVEISKLLRAVNELEIDNGRTLSFQVTHDGQARQMKIHVFKDDVDAVDLYFFAHVKLVEEIEEIIDVFCAEQGI